MFSETAIVNSVYIAQPLQEKLVAAATNLTAQSGMADLLNRFGRIQKYKPAQTGEEADAANCMEFYSRMGKSVSEQGSLFQNGNICSETRKACCSIRQFVPINQSIFYY